jgi:hypothetical protein
VLTLGAAAAICRRYPECESMAANGLPRLAVVTLESSDLAETARVLRAADVAFRETPEGAIVVAPHEACGTVIEFAASDSIAM